MKKKDLKDIRKKKIVELKKNVDEMKNKLVLTKSEMYAGKNMDLFEIRKLKRDIAQILTIITELEKDSVDEKVEEKKGAEK